MKIVIDNCELDYELGIKILKLKYQICPFDELKDTWDNIPELTFEEIAKLNNLEERRIAFLYFGNERLLKSVKPTLVDVQEIKKQTEWINKFGIKETINYTEKYELYKVNPEYFQTDRITPSDNFYFLKVKDTSTDREYIIWIDKFDIQRNNNQFDKEITALDAVAWTIRTNVPKGQIEKIIRQGEVVMFKVKENTKLLNYKRHLTKEEFVNLLKAES